MDSTIFNRRTLLGGGALAGLSALLAASRQITRRQLPPPPRRARRLRLLPLRLSHPRRAQPRLLFAATRVVRRRRMVNTVRLTNMVLPRTYPSPPHLKTDTAKNL